MLVASKANLNLHAVNLSMVLHEVLELKVKCFELIFVLFSTLVANVQDAMLLDNL